MEPTSCVETVNIVELIIKGSNIIHAQLLEERQDLRLVPVFEGSCSVDEMLSGSVIATEKSVTKDRVNWCN